ncbi:MAG: hypothetical protein KAG61_08240 [Bacteriovoracaceae bacterium]|nr:hypothetical protein [Bacteriovoracaceae bacterium]
MRKIKMNKSYIVVCGIAVLALSGYVSLDLLGSFLTARDARAELAHLSEVRSQIDSGISNAGEFPSIVRVDNQLAKVDYTFDQNLTRFVKKRLRRYRSDYSVITIIDNNNGEILTSVGFKRKGNQFDYQLPYSSTHPSASLIKIITTAGILSNTDVNNDTVFNYRGRGTTLYKYQLKNKKTRWSRYLTFEKAFALSNNVVFGKAAVNLLSSLDLFKMASSFGFNRNLFSDISAGTSTFPMPKDQYNLAELASGLNDEAMISPVHAAVLSSIVANEGILKFPRIVDQVVDLKTKEVLVDSKMRDEQVLSPEIISSIKKMMELTVSRGTARSSFKRMRRSVRKKLIIGGKTGTITGGVPFGRRDWFTAYARPKNDPSDRGISISVMNINLKKWYVKSSYLAKEIIEHYYKKKATKKLALK